MSFYKFDKKDILLNKIRSYPEVKIYVDSGNVYYNNSYVPGIKPVNHISGSELRVAQNSWNCRPVFVPSSSYDSPTVLPDTIWTKDYFLSSSANISSDYLIGAPVVYPDSPPDPKLSALKNTLNYYSKNSINYSFSSSIGGNSWYKPEQDMMLISIPSILYGSQIQPGSIKLSFYVTGTLAAELTDSTKRGDLTDDSGRTAGVALYNEGFFLLTGSWALGASTDTNYPDSGDNPRWKYFGYQNPALTDSTFNISFNGTTYTPSMTMFAHANKGELNSSNNPTFIKHSSSLDANQKLLVTSSHMYVENSMREVENVTSSSFASSGSFEKTSYLSSIGVYDDDHNLVGIAKLATPVRKREKDSYTFKIKMDL